LRLLETERLRCAEAPNVGMASRPFIFVVTAENSGAAVAATTPLQSSGALWQHCGAQPSL
jgi:hypothetical protein